MGFGRFICVLLPFLLTLASLISLLVAGLAGVVGGKKDVYMFRLNLTDLQVKPATIAGLISSRDIENRDIVSDLQGFVTTTGKSLNDIVSELAASGNSKAQNIAAEIAALAKQSGQSIESIAQEVATKANGNYEDLLSEATAVLKKASGSTDTSGNITAADLGLYKLYDVSLWGYCYTPQSGSDGCIPTKFNWAKTEVTNTLDTVRSLASLVGRNLTIPKDVTDGLNTYADVVRWTEIVFIIATVASGVALFLGIAANFSRAVSCLTWIMQAVATLAAIAFAGLATATAVVVVGLVESTAKYYGASANINSGYIAVAWLAVAFSVAAGIFWLATVCCCKPSERSHKRNSHSDAEKLVGGSRNASYAPINNGNQPGMYHNHMQQPTSYGAPHYPQGGRSDMAYEPYSSQRV